MRLALALWYNTPGVFFTNGMLIKYLPVKNTCKGGTVSATIAKR
jgi:hypothetical protein